MKGSNYDTDTLVGTDHRYLLSTPVFVGKHNVIKYIVSEMNFIRPNLGLGKGSVGEVLAA